MVTRIETIIIGGGQAGLAMSYCLAQQGRENVVIEQAARPAHVWADERWDSFTFVTPNWAIRLPGAEYKGDDPDGFMARADIIAYFDQYASRFRLPVEYNTRVTSVEPAEHGYLVRTERATYEAANVVMATGACQTSKTSPFSRDLPAPILQISSGTYRNPRLLPPGAALIVGSGQSGCQIAEELYQSGRKVYLSVGGSGRAPRRYRGKDIVWWMNNAGPWDRTPDKLPSPKARLIGSPQVSGKDGGHTLNLHQFARDGVTLLGHVQGVQNGRLFLTPDLKESLAKSDAFESEVVKVFDGFVTRTGMDAPQEQLPILRDGFDAEIIGDLNLASAGIATVIWAMGYSFDYSLVKLPLLDSMGFPVQSRGVTNHAGLYFVGSLWQTKQKSPLLIGVGDDAAFIATHIAARARV